MEKMIQIPIFLVSSNFLGNSSLWDITFNQIELFRKSKLIQGEEVMPFENMEIKFDVFLKVTEILAKIYKW